MPRRIVLFLVLALAATTLGAPAQSPGPSATPAWEAEVRQLLERRAQAVVSGNEAAFVATMEAAPENFRRDRLEWFRRLRTLPLGDYRLEFTQEEYGELTRASDRQRHNGEVHVIQVKERIGFAGYDANPAAEDLFLTVVKGRSGWSVVSDDDVESIALQSVRNIWDFGPVSRLERDGVMVIHHPSERDAAPRILDATLASRTTVSRVWPLPWRQNRIVVMIPSTVDELARILQTTFDLSTFVAFAASSIDRTEGWRLTGTRILLHWPNFRRYASSFQRTILQHELLHHATAEATGPFLTAALDEGVAQYYGESAFDPLTPQLRQRVRAGRFDGRLPEDWFFIAGPPNDIFLAYEEAVHFIAYVGSRFGRDRGARLYEAAASNTAVAPGTWRYHLDRASRAILGVPLDELERDWARAVTREFS